MKGRLESPAIIQADFQFAPAHYLLGGVYAVQGQYDKAISEFELARHWSSGSAKMAAALARAYALAGRRQDALRLLLELEQDSKHHHVSPYSMADAYMGLGDKQHALDLLERAAAEHSSDLLYLRYCPNFESLHDNRRFVRLVRKIGFPADIE